MSSLLKKLCMTVATFASASALAGVHFEPTLNISAEERFDDDLRLAQQQQDSGGPRTFTGLFMTKVSPQLGLKVTDPTLTVDSWYSLDFTLRKPSGGVTFDHRGRVTLQKRLTDRLRIDSDLRIWRVSDPTSLPRQGLATLTSPMLYGRGEAALGFQATRRLELRGGYRLEGARIEDASLGMGLTHTPFVEGWFRATPRSRFGLEYRLQYFVFELGDSRAEAVGPDIAIAHGVTAAWRYRLTRRMDLTVRGGPAFYSALADGNYELVPRLQVELFRDGEFFDLSLQAGHDLVGASGFNKAVWADFGTAHVEWRFWRPLRVYAAASVYRNDDAPNLNLQSFDPAVVDMGYALGAGVEWQALKNLSFTLSVDRLTNIAAPDAGRDVEAAQMDRNIASLRLNFRAF